MMLRTLWIGASLAIVVMAIGMVGIAQAADGWDYYRDITIDHTKVSGNQLTDFPVLISLHSDVLLTAAQDDGDDIIFTDGDNTQKLNHQLERYIEKSGSATMDAMVMIPTLSGTTDTTIRMWYGNGTCTSQQNPEAVWDTGFKAVFHLNEASQGVGTYDDHYDSTINNNDGELGSSPQLNPDAIGKIDGATDFNGTGNSYVEAADSNNLDIPGSFTLETWVKLDEFPDAAKQVSVLVCKRDDLNTGYCMGVTQNQEIRVAVGGDIHDTSGLNLQLETWYHIVSVYEHTNSGTVSVYVNGNPEFAEYTPGSLSATTSVMRIGACSFSAPCAFQTDGIIDEVRISDIARSPEWIATSYTNQNDPPGFYMVGAQNGAGIQQPVADMATIVLISIGILIIAGALIIRHFWRKSAGLSPIQVN